MLQSQALSTWTVEKTQQMLGACAPFLCALQLRSYFDRLDSSSIATFGVIPYAVLSPPSTSPRGMQPVDQTGGWHLQRKQHPPWTRFRQDGMFMLHLPPGNVWSNTMGAAYLVTVVEVGGIASSFGALCGFAPGLILRPHGSFVSYFGVLHNTRRTATTCFGLAA